MDREYYHGLARRKLRVPIGADLVLHERPDPKACRFSGSGLGEVLVEAAHRYHMPLAFPLMDLRIEKEWLLTGIGVKEADVDATHLDDVDEQQLAALGRSCTLPPTPRMVASRDAIAYVAAHSDLIPVGMCIGPFSLMTKLLSDPITAAYMVAVDPEDEDAERVIALLELGTELIARWVGMQVDAGARAVCVCEPAANIVYLSPNQLDENPGLLETLVIRHNRRIKEVLDAKGADLIFHDCGELNPALLRSFNELDPAILSLGSPCDLPTAAAHVSPRTVIMGNLPSKKFYSDSAITEEQVREACAELCARMEPTGHSFLLGTECDVLHVPGCECSLSRKVMALVESRD